MGQEIFLYAGQSIDDAYVMLNNSPDGSWCSFNGHKLYKGETLDEMYQKITHVTKEESERKIKEDNDKYERELAEHKARIPELTEMYKEKARGIIPEEHLDEWDRIVPIRLNDLYQGMELNCWLELITILNTDDEDKFEKAKIAFDNQGHSGMSAGLVFCGLRRFHPDGYKLVDYINNEYGC